MKKLLCLCCLLMLTACASASPLVPTPIPTNVGALSEFFAEGNPLLWYESLEAFTKDLETGFPNIPEGMLDFSQKHPGLSYLELCDLLVEKPEYKGGYTQFFDKIKSSGEFLWPHYAGKPARSGDELGHNFQITQYYWGGDGGHLWHHN